MSTSIILRAIDLIWPPSRQKDPSKQKDPKIWALNHTAKYLVLNSAAQVRNLAKKGNTGPKYSNDDMKLASAPKQNLKELLLEVDKTQDSNALQPGLTSIMLGQTELAAHSLPLAKIGAELGLLWQKIGNGQGEQTSTPSPPFTPSLISPPLLSFSPLIFHLFLSCSYLRLWRPHRPVVP